MCSFWSSNQQAILEDLALHPTSLCSPQNGSCLGEETRKSDKPRCHLGSRRSQETIAIYFNSYGTCTPPTYCTSHMPKITPVMMTRHSRHDEGSSWRSSPSDYAIVASSVRNVSYCRLFLALSHCTSTYPFLRDVTGNGIINWRHINLASPLPKHSYHL